MAEGFKVEPGQVAGFAVAAGQIASQGYQLVGHVNYEARPTGGFSGVMEIAKPFVDGYADAAMQRFVARSERISGLEGELNEVAWIYSGADQDAYVRHSAPMPGGGQAPPTIADYTDPVAYTAGNPPQLDPPAHEEADIRGLLDDVGGSINVIDDVVHFVTGWSPVSELVEPMSGNWTELARAGEVLDQVGDGAEQVAANLRAGSNRLLATWEGGAATAFHDFSERLAAAVEVEGPINRLVGKVYVQVSEEFEKVAEFMVSTLKRGVDYVIDAVKKGWIPFYGWKKAYDAVKEVLHVIEEAYNLIKDLQTAVETIETVIEAAKDPVGFTQEKITEALQPYLDAGEAAYDIGQLDPSAITDAPTSDYDVGSDPRRAG